MGSTFWLNISVFAEDLKPRERISLPGGYKVPSFVGFSRLGQLITAALPLVYVIAGLMLFGAIIFSGFNLLVSGGDEKKAAEAKGCLTNAVVGFIIIFASWWLVQILEIIFGIPILKP